MLEQLTLEYSLLQDCLRAGESQMLISEGVLQVVVGQGLDLRYQGACDGGIDEPIGSHFPSQILGK